ncbi:MAG: cbb3-type cytochrome c oxidase subunit I, partial [Thermoactinomyces sp.]
MNMNLGQGNIQTESSSLKLPLLIIVTGILELVVFFLLSLLSLAEINPASPRYPSGWAFTHLFVLGGASMIAMGAVYQLVPVVVNRPLYSKRMGLVHYGLFVIGHIGLVTGFFLFKTDWMALFATFLFLAILLFAANIVITLVKAKQWDPVTIHVVFALLGLILAGLTGMIMGYDFALGQVGTTHNQLLSAHLWLGAAGWFGNLIVGFTYKLLPMFSISHNYSVKPQKIALILLNIAILSGAGSAFLASDSVITKVPFILLSLGFLFFVDATRRIRKSGIKKNPGAGIAFTLKINTLMAITLLFLAGAVFLASGQQPFIVSIWIGLWGWVYFTIIGYMSKIVPFLWWTFKYGSQVGKEKVPMLHQLINEKRVYWLLNANALSFLVTTLGIVLSSSALFGMGFILFLISGLFYISI